MSTKMTVWGWACAGAPPAAERTAGAAGAAFAGLVGFASALGRVRRRLEAARLRRVGSAFGSAGTSAPAFPARPLVRRAAGRSLPVMRLTKIVSCGPVAPLMPVGPSGTVGQATVGVIADTEETAPLGSVVRRQSRQTLQRDRTRRAATAPRAAPRAGKHARRRAAVTTASPSSRTSRNGHDFPWAHFSDDKLLDIRLC